MKRKINRTAEIGDYPTRLYLSGVGPCELYTQPQVFKKVWDTSQNALKEIFGADDDKMEHITLLYGIYCPPISYGHLGCIGGEIRYPDALRGDKAGRG